MSEEEKAVQRLLAWLAQDGDAGCYHRLYDDLHTLLAERDRLREALEGTRSLAGKINRMLPQPHNDWVSTGKYNTLLADAKWLTRLCLTTPDDEAGKEK